MLFGSIEKHVSLFLEAPLDERIRVAVEATRRAWCSLLHARKAGCVADKSAYPCFGSAGSDDELFTVALHIKKLLFPDSIQIMIIRDPRDVLISSKYYFRSGELNKSELVSTINSWAACNFCWIADEPSLVIRYEDLKLNFEQTVRTIFNTLDEPLRPELLQEIKSKYEQIDYSRQQDAHFFRSGTIGQWKQDQWRAQNDLVVQNAAHIMQLFGYSADGEIGDSFRTPYQGFSSIEADTLLHLPWNAKAGHVHLVGNGIRCFIFADKFNVALRRQHLRDPAPHQKLLLLLTVSWDDALDHVSRHFSLSVLKASSETTLSIVEIKDRPFRYGASVRVGFELSHDVMRDIGEADSIRIGLFNGGVTRPFFGIVESVRYILVSEDSQLLAQVGHATPAKTVPKSDELLGYFQSVGWTSLHYAANWGMLSATTELVAAGNSVNAQERNGATPLHRAVDFNHLDVVRFLVTRGAAVNSVDNNLRETPLDLAYRRSFLEIAEYLKRNGGVRFSELDAWLINK